jgi:hypothetical protein
LWVVGSAAADQLIRGVSYWKSKGLSIDFFPYRIYQLDGRSYFEFFAKPYDRHVNPASLKGVLFNTNRRYDWLEGGYGARIDICPYLSCEESERLLEALRKLPPIPSTEEARAPE